LTQQQGETLALKLEQQLLLRVLEQQLLVLEQQLLVLVLQQQAQPQALVPH
jgi:hypothetical protein